MGGIFDTLSDLSADAARYLEGEEVKNPELFGGDILSPVRMTFSILGPASDPVDAPRIFSDSRIAVPVGRWRVAVLDLTLGDVVRSLFPPGIPLAVRERLRAVEVENCAFGSVTTVPALRPRLKYIRVGAELYALLPDPARIPVAPRQAPDYWGILERAPVYTSVLYGTREYEDREVRWLAVRLRNRKVLAYPLLPREVGEVKEMLGAKTAYRLEHLPGLALLARPGLATPL